MEDQFDPGPPATPAGKPGSQKIQADHLTVSGAS